MKLLKLAIYLMMAYSPFTQAHVQWFVAPEEMKKVSFDLDLFSFFICIFVILFTLLAIFITNCNKKPLMIEKLISSSVNISSRVYVSVFSVILVLFFSLQVIHGGFFAPNIVLPPEYVLLGMILQLAIVISASVSIVTSGFFVILATVFMVAIIPIDVSINYLFEFIAIGLFMMFTGNHVSSLDKKLIDIYNNEVLWSKAVMFLRVGIGIQLIVLAFTEKLIYPGLAVVFIEMFPFYNIFPSLGLAMGTDLHFVLFVGLCELSLGLLLTLGLANRLTMIMACGAFVTTAIIHGVHEIEGHLPIFAAAFVLLFDLKNNAKQVNSKEIQYIKYV